MWIEADIPCINFTPNQYNALAPASVYVNIDVTIPVNFTNEYYSNTYLQAYVNGAEFVFQSVDQQCMLENNALLTMLW